MDVEIITIGDEILTGHTVDTNAAFIARQVTGLGYDVVFRSSTGDTLEQMQDAFRLALQRARIIITTGGLGPTDDDNTKKAIVKVFKRNLVYHEDILEDIQQRYAKRGVQMPAVNQNQALLPQGATFFPNKFGSAVGILISDQGRTFISLPGVPHEMEQIMTDSVSPHLAGLRSEQAISVIKLRTTGIIESKLAEIIKSQASGEQTATLAYLPSFGGVDLRVIAHANDPEEANVQADELARELERAVGKYIFGRDDDTLESVVGQLLKDNDKTLSVAESCTAGTLGSLITSVSGSSDYFVGGILAYANDVKTDLLNVSRELLSEHGAVSEECALAMAEGCRTRLNTDYALAVTGIAGPSGGTEEKPVGTTFIGLSSVHTSLARAFNLGIHRPAVRSRAAHAALEMLRREILDIT